jgi:hypothetical protein
MKTFTLLALTLILTAAAHAVPAGTNVNIRGTLILASNEGQGLDSSLRAYERQLNRLNFSSFRAIGNGGTQLTVPGKGLIRLSGDFTVEVESQPAPGDRIPVEVRWLQGKRTLIHTSGTLPLVLGGPSHGNGTLILVIDGR